MRTKLSFALAAAALACGTVYGCGDDESSPSPGNGGSAGGGGRGGSGGSSGGSMGGSAGNNMAGEGGSGGSGNSSGSAGEDAGVEEDASVPDDASAPEEDASTGNGGTGGSGPGVDSGTEVDAGGLAAQIEALCPQWCSLQVAACDEVSEGACLGFCTGTTSLSTGCQTAVVPRLQCDIAANTWDCDTSLDAGSEAAIESTQCGDELDAVNVACAP